MRNHQWSIQDMFGDLTVGMREIVSVHDLEDEVVGDIAVVLADLFTTYVERGRDNRQCSIFAMFRELAVGMREIVQMHELKDEAVRGIAALLGELRDAYVRRRQWRNNHRAMHAMARELVVGMGEIIDTHDLGDEVVGRFAKILDSLLKTDLAPSRTRQAPVQELLDDVFAIYEGDRDQEQPSGHELLDELLAMSFQRRHKEQKPRRRGPHPAMVELLARLDRYGSNHGKSQSKAAPAAD